MASWLEWWNLVFVAPFLLAVLYYLLAATGTLSVDDADGDHDLEADDGGLSLLGIGRAPLSIVLTTFGLVWGFVGYAANQLLPQPAFVWASLLLAGAAAVLLTRSFANLVVRLVPRTQSYGIKRADLQGRPAEARYQITESFGSATVVDEHRFPHEVDCRVRPGEPPIPAGAKVFLVDYDAARDLFYVMSDQKLDELVASR